MARYLHHERDGTERDLQWNGASRASEPFKGAHSLFRAAGAGLTGFGADGRWRESGDVVASEASDSFARLNTHKWTTITSISPTLSYAGGMVVGLDAANETLQVRANGWEFRGDVKLQCNVVDGRPHAGSGDAHPNDNFSFFGLRSVDGSKFWWIKRTRGSSEEGFRVYYDNGGGAAATAISASTDVNVGFKIVRAGSALKLYSIATDGTETLLHTDTFAGRFRVEFGAGQKTAGSWSPVFKHVKVLSGWNNYTNRASWAREAESALHDEFVGGELDDLLWTSSTNGGSSSVTPGVAGCGLQLHAEGADGHARVTGPAACGDFTLLSRMRWEWRADHSGGLNQVSHPWALKLTYAERTYPRLIVRAHQVTTGIGADTHRIEIVEQTAVDAETPLTAVDGVARTGVVAATVKVERVGVDFAFTIDIEGVGRFINYTKSDFDVGHPGGPVGVELEAYSADASSVVRSCVDYVTWLHPHGLARGGSWGGDYYVGVTYSVDHGDTDRVTTEATVISTTTREALWRLVGGYHDDPAAAFDHAAGAGAIAEPFADPEYGVLWIPYAGGVWLEVNFEADTITRWEQTERRVFKGDVARRHFALGFEDAVAGGSGISGAPIARQRVKHASGDVILWASQDAVRLVEEDDDTVAYSLYRNGSGGAAGAPFIYVWFEAVDDNDTFSVRDKDSNVLVLTFLGQQPNGLTRYTRTGALAYQIYRLNTLGSPLTAAELATSLRYAIDNCASVDGLGMDADNNGDWLLIEGTTAQAQSNEAVWSSGNSLEMRFNDEENLVGSADVPDGVGNAQDFYEGEGGDAAVTAIDRVVVAADRALVLLVTNGTDVGLVIYDDLWTTLQLDGEEASPGAVATWKVTGSSQSGDAFTADVLVGPALQTSEDMHAVGDATKTIVALGRIPANGSAGVTQVLQFEDGEDTVSQTLQPSRDAATVTHRSVRLTSDARPDSAGFVLIGEKDTDPAHIGRLLVYPLVSGVLWQNIDLPSLNAEFVEGSAYFPSRGVKLLDGVLGAEYGLRAIVGTGDASAGIVEVDLITIAGSPFTVPHIGGQRLTLTGYGMIDVKEVLVVGDARTEPCFGVAHRTDLDPPTVSAVPRALGFITNGVSGIVSDADLEATPTTTCDLGLKFLQGFTYTITDGLVYESQLCIEHNTARLNYRLPASLVELERDPKADTLQRYIHLALAWMVCRQVNDGQKLLERDMHRSTAEGPGLDRVGGSYGTPRQAAQSDTNYRATILEKAWGHPTPGSMKRLVEAVLGASVTLTEGYRWFRFEVTRQALGIPVTADWWAEGEPEGGGNLAEARALEVGIWGRDFWSDDGDARVRAARTIIDLSRPLGVRGELRVIEEE